MTNTINSNQTTFTKILSKEKCKVSELLLLCQEDPDSVIDLFKSNRGNKKCLPDIEIDPESLQYFEKVFKSEECVPKLKSLSFNLVDNAVKESNPINQRDLKSEHSEGLKGILKMDKPIIHKRDDSKTPLKSIFKNPLLCNDEEFDQEGVNLSTVTDLEQRENETVVTEYVEISTLLPKIISPLAGAKSRKQRRQRQKRNYIIYGQEGESTPKLTSNVDSPAVAILKQVVKEHKRQMKYQDNKLHERESKIETKQQNMRKSKDRKHIFSFLNSVNRGKYGKL